MAFKQILEQDMGVLFHMRCLTPMIYIATSDPVETVAGFKETFEPKKHTLKVVEGVTFDDLSKHVPTSDEIIFVLINNPGDWFANAKIVEALGDGNPQLRLNHRYLQRLVFIGPPDLTAPESLRSLMPRIEESFQLVSERPEPEPASEERLDETRKIIKEVLGNLNSTTALVMKDKIEAVARVVAHLNPPEIDNTMAQAAIRAKETWAKEGEGFGKAASQFMKDPAPFVSETLDKAHRLNGWPVYEVK